MRIAIITQPLRYNYGGILQNYALQLVLRRLGHDVTTIELPESERRSFSARIKEIIKNVLTALSDKEGRLLHFYGEWSDTLTLSTNMRQFIKRHIKEKKYQSYPISKEYEAFVVGSDQVWRPMYSNLDNAFLKFAEQWANKKRIAYAASFGTEEWEYTEEQTEKYKSLASLFDAISVREKSGIDICKKYLNVDATHVLDPTLLLTKEEYTLNLGLDSSNHNNTGLFYYFLDQNEYKRKLLVDIANQNGWNTYTVNSKVEDTNAPLRERIQPPIEEWLQGFIDASFVVTDSFHGTVFSIIFNKPFLVIANPKRGLSRFNSLLGIIGQQYRMLYEGSSIAINQSILEKPDADIQGYQKLSLDFIERFLKCK